MKPNLRYKRRIVVTGNRPDPAPVYRQYLASRQVLDVLKRSHVDRSSGCFQRAVRAVTRHQLRHALLCAKAMQCTLIVSRVPFKRPGRTTERWRTIAEQLKEAA